MKIVSIAVASALIDGSANVWAASGREDSVERLQAAADVLHSIQAAPDHGIPDSVLNDAKCIIVVPSLIKGGFIFGAKHGRGVATCRTVTAGARPPSFLSAAAAGACRSASKKWIWSCWL
jgi:lipid-binding SYLF domain-containing protein